MGDDDYKVVKDFQTYLNHLSGGRKDIENYLLKWSADLIQHPERKNGVALYMYSDEK